MNVQEFLLHHTRAEELCIVLDGGWTCAAAWIDHEDLFIGGIPEEIRKREVKSDRWGTLRVSKKNGKFREICCHYLEV